MGIIRLTLFTAIGLGGAMLWFGRDADLPEDRLGYAPRRPDVVVTAPVATAQVPVAEAPVTDGAADPGQPVAAAPDNTPADNTLAGDTVPASVLPASTLPASTVPGDAPPDSSQPDGSQPENAPPAATGPAIAAAVEAAIGAVPEAETGIGAAPELPPALPLLYVTGTTVNMRAGASTDNPVVARLPRGTAVALLGAAAAGWSEIEVQETGQRGFMASRFLSSERP